MKPVAYVFVQSMWIGDRELIMYRQKDRYMVFDSYNDYSLVFAGDYEKCDEFMERQRDEFL